MTRPAISPAGPPVETACCVCSEFGPCLPIQVRGQALILHVGACCFEAWRKKTGGAPGITSVMPVIEIVGSQWSPADL